MSTCVILAAGQGKRMRSPLPKVAHSVLGVPMVIRVVREALAAGLSDPVVVVGFGRERVIPLLEEEGVRWAVQEEQLGTAHAVSCGLGLDLEDGVVVLLGDVPLLRSSTIARLEKARMESKAGIAVLSTEPPDPTGYGRMILQGEELEAIVENRDATPEQLLIREINTGLMSFEGSLLARLLEGVRPDNDQGEYYLTDTIALARAEGISCVAVHADDWKEVAGINDRIQLSAANLHLRNRVCNSLLAEGVDIPDPSSVWLEDSVRFGRSVSIGRCCRVSGSSSIGDGCVLGDGCIVSDTAVPSGTILSPYTVMVGDAQE